MRGPDILEDVSHISTFPIEIGDGNGLKTAEGDDCTPFREVSRESVSERALQSITRQILMMTASIKWRGKKKEKKEKNTLPKRCDIIFLSLSTLAFPTVGGSKL